MTLHQFLSDMNWDDLIKVCIIAYLIGGGWRNAPRGKDGKEGPMGPAGPMGPTGK